MQSHREEELLERLAASPDEYVSGQELARRFKVSRTSIWKRLAKLRRLGYRIGSSSRRGYRLLRPVDPLLPRLVRQRLKGGKMGRKVVYHPVVTSTMDVAAELLAAGEREGTVILAERQLKGRGRQGREWSSAAGVGLWMSVILEPKISPLLIGRLTLTASSAAAEAVEETCGLSAGVKWPNDIYVGGRKLAGVLIEMSGELDIVRYLVLGLGVNVNTRAAEFPRALRRTATSILIQTGKPLDRRTLLAAFLRRLEKYYAHLKSGNLGAMLAGWRAREMTLGRKVVVHRAGGKLAGTAVDLAEDGALVVKRRDGVRERVYCGDVVLVDSPGKPEVGSRKWEGHKSR